MIYLLLIVIFFLGASAASFAGVLLERSRKEDSWWKRFRSVATTRSICVGCKRVLAWRQLIPIVGRRLQKGKCKHCKSHIPRWYSWFEAAMGVVFVLIFLFGGASILSVMTGDISGLLLLQWLLAWAILSLLIADILRYEVDLFFVLTLLGAGLWLHTLPGIAPAWGRMGALWRGGFFGVFWAGSYLLTYLRYGKRQAGMGTGDVLLALVLGAISSQPGDTNWMIVVQYLSLYMILASSSTLIFRALRTHKHKQITTYLPFIPGMLLAWVVIPYVRAWYIGW